MRPGAQALIAGTLATGAVTAGVLIADDVTVVGIVDDVALVPVGIATAAVVSAIYAGDQLAQGAADVVQLAEEALAGDGETSPAPNEGNRTPAPFLPNDPYSPEETSRRQSGNRVNEGAPSADPDSAIPDRGSGSDQGGHASRGRTPHESGERNVNDKEEHSRRTKGNPSGTPRRN